MNLNATRLCPACGRTDPQFRDFCPRCGEDLRWGDQDDGVHDPADWTRGTRDTVSEWPE